MNHKDDTPAGRKKCSRIHGAMRPSFAAMRIIEAIQSAKTAESLQRNHIEKSQRIKDEYSYRGPDDKGYK